LQSSFERSFKGSSLEVGINWRNILITLKTLNEHYSPITDAPA
jgi:hypothetical protein